MEVGTLAWLLFGVAVVLGVVLVTVITLCFLVIRREQKLENVVQEMRDCDRNLIHDALLEAAGDHGDIESEDLWWVSGLVTNRLYGE